MMEATTPSAPIGPRCQYPENQETRIEDVRLLRLDVLSTATDACERVLIEVQAGRHGTALDCLRAARLALRVARGIAGSTTAEIRP